MAERVVIDKNKSLRDSQDYALLRDQGVEYIQTLSGKIWTDHNLHDPGITILELLCYALTDLGYRTDFDVKDLLARSDGLTDLPEVSGLFPAHEILTNTPLTIHDYRRLLLKIEGIRNAWLDPMMDPTRIGNYKESEIPIYADCLAGGLSYESVNALGNDNLRVRLSGLYKVLLELEIDDVLGSLNETRLVYTVRRGLLKGVVISLDSDDPAFHSGDVDFTEDFDTVADVVSVNASGSAFIASVRIQLSDATEVVLQDLDIRVINDRPRVTEDPVSVTALRLRTVLGENLEDAIMRLFWSKQQIRKRTLDTVCCVLDAHRNLCEDFLSIRTVAPEHVAICADIIVKSDADIEEVQARAYHEIEKYFNPPVRYFTLKELLDEGLCTDEIFNGPYIDFSFTCGGGEVFTKPGFLKREDLDASELRRFIYVSDIINILMDFEEIVAVKNVLLRKYDFEGTPIGPSERWCLEISPDHQPVLSIERSKILFFKGEIPYRAKRLEFEQTLAHLRAMALKAAYVDPNQILTMPRGEYRETDAFYSIQHDFPKTYAIGRAGLPATASNDREAQAHQLKAYLTFFDQVLADYLSQLANVRRLFSLDKTLRQTYFSRYLSDIAAVRTVFEDEFYVDKTILQDDVRRNRLTEDEVLFFDRRNRFLDHLTARFAEQFTDYVLMMFSLSGDRLKTDAQLVDDKIDFLREYPIVSRERNKGFNFRPEDPADIWDTDNVSGVEKRVSRLLGIDSFLRRNLGCDEHFEMFFRTREIGGQFRVEVRAADNSVIFKSQQLFVNRGLAVAAAAKIYPFVRQEDTYEVDASGGVDNVFFTMAAGGAILRHDELFETEADAVQQIRAVIDRYDELLLEGDVCDDEGFHLFEHILLRPFTNQDELMHVCLDPDCKTCGEEDPYSFRITVVLPYWPERFTNLDFRRFFERTLREETPAHIHARICWIANDQMLELDEKYRAWLEAKSVKDFDQTELTDTLRELIQLLQRLKTIYPAARLHDCSEGEDENPVRLGSTNLGIF
ncbi:MAG TPA: hypothetical protein VIL33_03405 [Rhodothermia bacterium]